MKRHVKKHPKAFITLCFALIFSGGLLWSSSIDAVPAADTTSAPATAFAAIPAECAAADAPAKKEKKTFTVEELAKFDGKEGRKAYVAVDGIVYDVTANKHWPLGVHKDCSKGAIAGKDLTEILKVSPPAMRKFIKQQPAVGELKK